MASSEKESTTAPAWADAPRAKITAREWAAMRRCCCQVPGMALPRSALGALGLVLMCMGVAVSVGCLLEGPPRGASGVLPTGRCPCQSSPPSKIALALAYFSRRLASCSAGLSPHPANRVSSELWARSASLTFTATGFPLMART